VHRCVWSRNLVNDEALAHWRLLHKTKKYIHLYLRAIRYKPLPNGSYTLLHTRLPGLLVSQDIILWEWCKQLYRLPHTPHVINWKRWCQFSSISYFRQVHFCEIIWNEQVPTTAQKLTLFKETNEYASYKDSVRTSQKTACFFAITYDCCLWNLTFIVRIKRHTQISCVCKMWSSYCKNRHVHTA